MALDARRRSLIYQSLVPVIGDENANALMSEFPAIEADELVTKQFLRAELAEFRTEFRTELAKFRTDAAQFRADMHEQFHRQSVTIVGLVIAATALIEALTTLV